MKNPRSLLFVVCTFLLLFSVLGARAQESQDEVFDAEPAEAGTPQELEEEDAAQVIRVVGTRVKQIDFETTTPTAIYDAEEIERTGYATLGDFVQNLPH